MLLYNASKRRQAMTFDEITLADQPVDFHPNDVNLKTWITRNIYLNGCGIMAAAMDTVCEQEMALAMAKMGGIGILHRNLSPEEQAEQLRWVRRKIHWGGMIDKPISFKPTDRFSSFQRALKEFPFTSFPVVDEERKMLGLITRDQVDFVEGCNPMLKDVMLPIADVVTGKADVTSTEEAYKIMSKRKVKKLPILDDEGVLQGMYVWNDVKSDQRKRERFSLDCEGHFLVGAAIGVGPADLERARLLVDRGCKLLVLDSSHGSCGPVKKQIIALRKLFADGVDIIAGNIASYASAMYLLNSEAKPDGLKVGIGPGSICTTRQVTGHGIPQVTAINEVWRAVRDYGKQTGFYVPIIADGGIRTSGDIVKSFSVGASAVMMGSIFAGTKESPGQLVVKGGRSFKMIRGMGSRGAMEAMSGSRGRYFRNDDKEVTEEVTSQQAQKMVPEGVEGLVLLTGTCEKVMMQLLGGVQSGLAHSGSKSVKEFQNKANVWAQSFAGMAEGKPHDISDVRA